jgi:electron transport complex protein RnfD
VAGGTGHGRRVAATAAAGHHRRDGHRRDGPGDGHRWQHRRNRAGRDGAARAAHDLRGDGAWGAAGGEWVALAWLAGGLWLLQRRAITWHVPLGCVVGVTLTAALLYEGDGAHGGSSPLLHLLAGGTLLVAFFALTEPRGRPQTHAGQLLVGLFAGALVVALREHAGGADRAAVVVLLANALAPAFDALGTRLRRPPNRPPRLGAHDAAPPEGPAPHTDGRT